jgi:signal transduction histidine kinase
MSFNPRLISPASIINRAAASYKPAAQEKGIFLKIQVEPELPEVYVDPDRMAQVMGHLLDNALEHTPENEEISLATRGVDGNVELKVADSGPGIPEEELPYVFDRFYRGDKSRQRHEGGSGLGLAIARSIVESQGGEIRAESRSGQGTAFIVCLPPSGESLPNDRDSIG